jgi:hypothetical protein
MLADSNHDFLSSVCDGYVRVLSADTYLGTRTLNSRTTHHAHTRQVPDQHSEREQALRSLPLTYSLALRLRDAGAAPEVISEYLGVDESALAGVLRIAEAKLASAQDSGR